jgi:hypothetical protein
VRPTRCGASSSGGRRRLDPRLPQLDVPQAVWDARARAAGAAAPELVVVHGDVDDTSATL